MKSNIKEIDIRTVLMFLGLAGLISLGLITRKKMSVNKITTEHNVRGTYSSIAVLELFTSEGCSSCPPADNLLPQLANIDPGVIPLSFHVDYWNRLGWKDPFSSSEFSERQRTYADNFRIESVYTPQLVVNGEYEMVGSSKEKAEEAIKKVLEEKTGTVLSIEDLKKDNGKLSFTVNSGGAIYNTNIIAALAEKKTTVNVKAGENSGATLTHINVVRGFALQATTTKNKFEIAVPNDIKENNWQLIVYCQQRKDLKIIGAASFEPVN